MTVIEDGCLARLQDEGRLLSPAVCAESTRLHGRFVYRGELALKFAATTEREKRPPELKVEQVLMASDAASGKVTFLAAYMLSFESLAALAEVLKDMLTPEGKYFAFCNNIDLSAQFQVPLEGATFYVLPLDESSVFNELLELLKLEKNDLKKLSSVEKVDAIASAAEKFKKRYETISYQRGLELMGPVKDPGENRPV
jgi:hypothetical protein